MMVSNNSDNLYKVGSWITAKVHPELQLEIKAYFQRIYYCAVIGQPDLKRLAYFERELITPVYSFLKIEPRKVQHVFGIM
jgi:hypothetical protein